MPPRAYHHGGLRRAVLDAALQAIADSGPSSVSLRDLARRVGVSHAGPAHHFGSKEGVFTALAAEGFALLAEELVGDDPGSPTPRSMADLAVAYVGFALRHRAHFEVMFRPDLYDTTDPALTDPSERARSILTEASRVAVPHHAAATPVEVELSAWALVHGFATLATSQAVELGSTAEVELLVRAGAAMMFQG